MSPYNRDSGSEASQAYTRPTVIILDEKKWVFLKKRYHMTPRELQVAILVCRGFSNEEISDALDIRNGTVKTHLRNIYRRARVKNKITLLLRFIEDVENHYPGGLQFKPRVPIVERKSETSAHRTIK